MGGGRKQVPARKGAPASMKNSGLKAFKATLRAALAARARGMPLTEAEDTALIRLTQFKDVDPHSARLLAALAIDISVTVIACRERCCPQTVHNRIAASLGPFLGNEWRGDA